MAFKAFRNDSKAEDEEGPSAVNKPSTNKALDERLALGDGTRKSYCTELR